MLDMCHFIMMMTSKDINRSCFRQKTGTLVVTPVLRNFTPNFIFQAKLKVHMGQTDEQTDRQARPVMQPIRMAA